MSSEISKITNFNFTIGDTEYKNVTGFQMTIFVSTIPTVELYMHSTTNPVEVFDLAESYNLVNELYEKLSKKFMCDYDETGTIGKRYRREDEIGTPFCITVDFDTLEDNCVTIRNRDTMEQERIAIDKVEEYILEKIQF
jgi:glycyl-tRNA synthetase